MTPMETPAETLQRWFSAHAAGDLEMARQLVVDDLEVVVPGERLRGFDALMSWYDVRATTQGASFRYDVEDLLSGNEHAAAVLRLHTDQRSWRQIALYQVRNGRINAIWAAEDL